MIHSLPLSITGISAAMPEKIINNSFFSPPEERKDNPMFRGTYRRRHYDREDRASDILAVAAQKVLAERYPCQKPEIDLLITNAHVTDELFMGVGASVVKRLGIRIPHIYDLHNSGCVSTVFMAELAGSIMEAKKLRSCLILNSQMCASRLFSGPQGRKKAQSMIPGDGSSALLLEAVDESPIISISTENFPESSDDMYGAYDDGTKWWEPGVSEMYIDFSEAKIAKVMYRGNQLVPEMIRRACKKAGMDISDIDYLITNQPNHFFLKNWREAVQVSEEKHLHTFDKYGNLFGAGIPVTLAEATKNKIIEKGSLVCLAGFSHAGDYAGALIYRH